MCEFYSDCRKFKKVVYFTITEEECLYVCVCYVCEYSAFCAGNQR
jgi:hypothetical protein